MVRAGWLWWEFYQQNFFNPDAGRWVDRVFWHYLNSCRSKTHMTMAVLLSKMEVLSLLIPFSIAQGITCFWLLTCFRTWCCCVMFHVECEVIENGTKMNTECNLLCSLQGTSIISLFLKPMVLWLWMITAWGHCTSMYSHQHRLLHFPLSGYHGRCFSSTNHLPYIGWILWFIPLNLE